jgi:site-specific DNA recombinase
MKKVAIYTRVSSQEQVQDGNSLEIQKRDLTIYAKDTQIWETYTDAGFSAKDDKRPSFQRMIFDAEAHRFDCIIVTKLDRIFRSMKNQYNFVDKIDRLGINFIAIQDNMDLATPQGRLMFGFLGTMAEQERRRLGERIRDTRRLKASQNVWTCGRTPFGYRFDKATKTLVIEPLEADSVSFIFYHYVNDDIGIIRLAELCNREGKITPRLGKRKNNLWNQSAIRYVLTHYAYTGQINTKWVFKCPEIISPELYELAQKKLRNNLHFKPATNIREFQGLLKCPLCGHTLRIGYNHSVTPYYECPGRLKRLHLDGTPRCTLPRFHADTFDKSLKSQIIDAFNSPEKLKNHIIETASNLENEVKELQRRIFPLNAEMDRIKGDMDKANTMFRLNQMDNQEYEAIITGCTVKLKELEKQKTDVDPLMLLNYQRKESLVKVCKNMIGLPEKVGGFNHLWTAFNDNPESVVNKINNEYGESHKKDGESMLELIKTVCKSPRDLMRKWGLIAYVYPDRIELKGNLDIGESLVTPSYNNNKSLPLNITLDMPEGLR